MQIIGPQAYHRLPTNVHAISAGCVCREWVNPQLSGVGPPPQAGKLSEQTVVGPLLIRCHLSICECGQQGIDGECPATVPEARRARGVMGHDLRKFKKIEENVSSLFHQIPSWGNQDRNSPLCRECNKDGCARGVLNSMNICDPEK